MKNTMKNTLAAVTLGVGCLALAPAAHGEPQCSAQLPAYNPCSVGNPNARGYSGPDLDYLQDLNRQHIPYLDSPTAVDVGHTVCAEQVGDPASDHTDRATKLVLARWPGSLTKDQAFQVVMVSVVHNLCPDTPDATP